MDDRKILHHSPLPIARSYRRYRNAAEVKERHDAAYYLFEIYLKYLASVAIAQDRDSLSLGSRGGTEIPREAWVPVPTDPGSHEEEWMDKPRWSADGKLLYLLSNRDGRQCLYAHRLDEDKKFLGSALEIHHFHDFRISHAGGLVPLELSVAVDQIVINLADVTGNIWMADLKEEGF